MTASTIYIGIFQSIISGHLWTGGNNLQKYHFDIIMMHVSWRLHEDAIKWKQFPCYWPFVRGIHRSPVNFPHKFQWALVLFYLRLNNRLSKQSRRRWFETPSHSLWRHCNVLFGTLSSHLLNLANSLRLIWRSTTRSSNELQWFGNMDKIR